MKPHKMKNGNPINARAHALRMRQIKRCKTPPLISHIVSQRHAGLKKCKLVSTLLNIFCPRAHNRLNAGEQSASNCARGGGGAAPKEYTCKYDSGKLGAAAHSQSRLLSGCASGEQASAHGAGALCARECCCLGVRRRGGAVCTCGPGEFSAAGGRFGSLARSALAA
jgi:hypothetical protein